VEEEAVALPAAAAAVPYSSVEVGGELVVTMLSLEEEWGPAEEEWLTVLRGSQSL